MAQLENKGQSDSGAEPVPEALLNRVRCGGSSAEIGQLLELYRNYLTLLAKSQIDTRLMGRFDASDIVQETFLDAHRDIQNFAGQCEAELISWLRKMLIRNIMDQVKRQGAQKRDFRREQSLEAELNQSGARLLDALGGSVSTPSRQLVRREQSVILADAIADLPEDYRNVIVYRNIYHWQFPKIGEVMNKSSGAVRMIWLRALEQLRKAMK